MRLLECHLIYMRTIWNRIPEWRRLHWVQLFRCPEKSRYRDNGWLEAQKIDVCKVVTLRMLHYVKVDRENKWKTESEPVWALNMISAALALRACLSGRSLSWKSETKKETNENGVIDRIRHCRAPKIRTSILCKVSESNIKPPLPYPI